MSEKNYGFFFKTIQRIARLILPRYHFDQFSENETPIVYVAHHQNLIGPISILVWLKYYVRTWVLGEFTHPKSAYNHYLNFTFTERYGWSRFISKILAWPAAHLVSWLTKSGNMIPVYRGSRRIIETMDISHEALLNGENILIFPDIDYSNESTETSNIYEGFLHLEKKYFKDTGKHLTFQPVFSDHEKNIVRIGNKIHFTGEKPFIEERKIVANQIKEELNRLAEKII